MFSSIHNYYEQMVLEEILRIAKEREEMDSELMADIACLALNSLPARYVRHNVDVAFNISDTERENMYIQVSQVVNKAIAFSKRRHEPR